MSQIQLLSLQAFPNGKNFSVKVFTDVVTISKYSYIILNFSSGEGHVYIRVLTSLFPHEFLMVGYEEFLCSLYEKLVLVNEELLKCLSSKEKDNSVSNSLNSLVNNIIFYNDTTDHSSINYEPDKSATSISKCSIQTTASKNVESDDEDGNKNESTYTEENVRNPIKNNPTNSEKNK